MELSVKNITNWIVGCCIVLCAFQHVRNNELFNDIDSLTTVLLCCTLLLICDNASSKLIAIIAIPMFVWYGCSLPGECIYHFEDANECLLLFGIYISSRSELALLALFILIGKFITGFSSPYAFSFLEFIDLCAISFVTFEKYKHKIIGYDA